MKDFWLVVEKKIPAAAAGCSVFAILLWSSAPYLVPMALMAFFAFSVLVHRKKPWIWLLFTVFFMMALRMWWNGIQMMRAERVLKQWADSGAVVSVEGVLGPTIFREGVKRSEFRLQRFRIEKIDDREILPYSMQVFFLCPAPCFSYFSGTSIRMYATIRHSQGSIPFIAVQECSSLQNCAHPSSPRILPRGWLIGVKERWLKFARETYACGENPLSSPCKYLGMIFGTQALWLEWQGEKKLYSDVVHTFRETGLIHLLVPSGSHLSVFLFVLLLLDSAYFRKFRFLFYGSSGMVLFLIAHLFDGIPMSRAVLMSIFALMNRFFYWPYDGVNSVMLAGSILLLFEPSFLWHPTFLLTFSASLGMATFLPYVVRNWTFLPIWMRKAVGVGIGPSLFLIPALTAIYGAIPLLAPVANAFVLLLSAVILFVGILSGLFLFIPYVSQLLLWLLLPAFYFLEVGIGLILRVPNPLWWNPFRPVWFYALCFVAFFVAVEALRFRWGKGWLQAGILGAFLLILVMPFFQPLIYIWSNFSRPAVFFPESQLLIAEPIDSEWQKLAQLSRRLGWRRAGFLLSTGNWTEAKRGKAYNSFAREGITLRLLPEQCGKKELSPSLKCEVQTSPVGRRLIFSAGSIPAMVEIGKDNAVFRASVRGVSICWEQSTGCSAHIQIAKDDSVRFLQAFYSKKTIGIYLLRSQVRAVEM